MKTYFLSALTVICLFRAGVAPAATYLLPASGEDVVGDIEYATARHEDTFSDIARRFDLGYEELVLANPGVDPWLPGEGTRVRLPTLYVLPDAPRDGIVLNVPEMRLYYYPVSRDGEPPRVITYPVSIGRGDWETPLGSTTIVAKDRNPVWRPPESIREEHADRGDPLPKTVPAGPDNPLGEFALRLGLPGYLIHGTNRPYGIGMRVTHGCIRLYPVDVAALFESVPVGTTVRIVHQPYKLGWRGGRLYMEAHPPLGEEARTRQPLSLTPLVQAWLSATGHPPGPTPGFRQARQLAIVPTGIPQELNAAAVYSAADPQIP